MRGVVALLIATLLGGSLSAWAGECPGRPDSLGTERVLVVDPKAHPRIGTMQYPESLPLADKEVVLTFDDGPLPLYTDRILQTLAAECVKATFFMVGRQARAYPAMVRKVYNEGHTVASHSQNHPRIFTRLRMPAAEQEVEQGIQSINGALGDPNALSPFFRFPGLGRSQQIEGYLAGRGIMSWSADFLADDWRHISGQQVLHRALDRLEKRGKGILLLHDIQPATALMLPQLLRELKARGYHIVQVLPAGVDRPETVTEPQSWVMRKPPKPVWPVVLNQQSTKMQGPSAQSFGWPRPFRASMVVPTPIPPVTTVPTPRDDAPAAAEPAVGGRPWMKSASPVPSFGLPPGLGELTLSWTAPAGSLVAPQEIFASMIAPSGPRIHAKPRPAASKTRPPTLQTSIFPIPRPKVVAHTPGPKSPRSY